MGDYFLIICLRFSPFLWYDCLRKGKLAKTTEKPKGETDMKSNELWNALKQSTRETITRIAKANGITPAAALSRMVRGEYLRLFAE